MFVFCQINWYHKTSLNSSNQYTLDVCAVVFPPKGQLKWTDSKGFSEESPASNLRSLWTFYSSPLGLPRARLTASASVILETDTVKLSCENTEDLKMEMCVFIINGRESNTKQSSSCQLSLTGSQISIWSGGQSSSVRITCFFNVEKRRVQKSSAHSDPVTVTVQSKVFICICWNNWYIYNNKLNKWPYTLYLSIVW